MSIDPETDGRQAAEEFRAQHGLGDQPLGDLITIIEQTTGVDITVLDVHASEHGMAMRDPGVRGRPSSRSRRRPTL